MIYNVIVHEFTVIVEQRELENEVEGHHSSMLWCQSGIEPRHSLGKYLDTPGLAVWGKLLVVLQSMGEEEHQIQMLWDQMYREQVWLHCLQFQC